jgi:hypothetical protein
MQQQSRHAPGCQCPECSIFVPGPDKLVSWADKDEPEKARLFLSLFSTYEVVMDSPKDRAFRCWLPGKYPTRLIRNKHGEFMDKNEAELKERY